MPLGGLLTGLGAGAASGVVGAITSGGAQGKALDQAKKAADLYGGLNPPDAAELRIELQNYQNTGQVTPRLQQLVQQAKSGMSSITTDPAEHDAQMSALASLQNEAENGGHTLAQDAYLNKVQSQVNAENAGREGAIEERYAMRGMGQPGGISLAAQEMNNQNMTQKENEASLEAANQAQQAALQSLQGAGHLAGEIQNQDFTQKAAVQRAQDSINQFNTQMAAGTNAANTAAQNNAQYYNTEKAQRISDANTGLRNQQTIYNAQVPQQVFQNNLAKTSGQANAMTGVANQYNNIATTDANMWGNIGQGAAKAGAAIAQGAPKSGGTTNNYYGSSSGSPWAGSDNGDDWSNAA